MGQPPLGSGRSWAVRQGALFSHHPNNVDGACENLQAGWACSVPKYSRPNSRFCFAPKTVLLKLLSTHAGRPASRRRKVSTRSHTFSGNRYCINRSRSMCSPVTAKQCSITSRMYLMMIARISSRVARHARRCPSVILSPLWRRASSRRPPRSGSHWSTKKCRRRDSLAEPVGLARLIVDCRHGPCLTRSACRGRTCTGIPQRTSALQPRTQAVCPLLTGPLDILLESIIAVIIHRVSYPINDVLLQFSVLAAIERYEFLLAEGVIVVP